MSLLAFKVKTYICCIRSKLFHKIGRFKVCKAVVFYWNGAFLSIFPFYLLLIHLFAPIFLPLYVSFSESVLELSIMPKDEDVLQLVRVSMRLTTHFLLPHMRGITRLNTGRCRTVCIHWCLSAGSIQDLVILKECRDFVRVTHRLSALCLK